MKTDLVVAPPAPQDTVGTPLAKRRIFYPWDILLPAAIVFWALGVSRVNAAHLGVYGLPVILPVVFYVGIGLVIISTGWALAMAQPSPVRLSAHLGVFLLMLYGTAPLVYSQARYSWVYKYIGVVQYINLHGRVNQRIDIFQNWPGFFALIAWFDRVAGIQSPLSYAKWAQLIFEALICIMLYFAFRALQMTVRERWLALFVYAGSIWIAQDYLSAQALGVVLSAGIFALALNYLSRTDEAKWLTWTRNRLQPVSRFLRHSKDSTARVGAQAEESDLLPVPEGSSGHDGAIVAAISLLYFVLVFEHELSPYVVLIQLGCLAAIGRIRHRWLVLLLMLVVVGYFAPRFTYVNNQFGILASIGNFFGNATPPLVSLGRIKVSPGITFSAEAARILTVGMWALGAVGAWRRWRDRRPTLALVLLAYSPALVFFAGAYGTEGLLACSSSHSLGRRASSRRHSSRWQVAPRDGGRFGHPWPCYRGRPLLSRLLWRRQRVRHVEDGGAERLHLLPVRDTWNDLRGRWQLPEPDQRSIQPVSDRVSVRAGGPLDAGETCANHRRRNHGGD